MLSLPYCFCCWWCWVCFERFGTQGNAQPQGFGHIGFILDDLEASCAQMEKLRPKHLLCFWGWEWPQWQYRVTEAKFQYRRNQIHMDQLSEVVVFAICHFWELGFQYTTTVTTWEVNKKLWKADQAGLLHPKSRTFFQRQMHTWHTWTIWFCIKNPGKMALYSRNAHRTELWKCQKSDNETQLEAKVIVIVLLTG